MNKGKKLSSPYIRRLNFRIWRRKGEMFIDRSSYLFTYFRNDAFFRKQNLCNRNFVRRAFLSLDRYCLSRIMVVNNFEKKVIEVVRVTMVNFKFV